ncbi:very short patch repair endonuclease [Dehalococcoides mccartyi]|nr:very short patch repair endonuclease [Dehalococcoides mccartyi]
MDKLSPARRSWNMSRIQSRNTKPEILVRSMLHRLGYRFRIHMQGLPGQPDIVLRRHLAIILVHGCFWHRHKGCKLAYTPKSRLEFWERKFDENIRRDEEVMRELVKMGWRVLTIWECQITDPKELQDRLIHFMKEEQE